MIIATMMAMMAMYLMATSLSPCVALSPNPYSAHYRHALAHWSGPGADGMAAAGDPGRGPSLKSPPSSSALLHMFPWIRKLPGLLLKSRDGRDRFDSLALII